MEGQTPYISEKVARTSDIRFEPGIHPRTESEQHAVYDNFNKGNLDANGWNKEVSERIASYAYDAPELLLTLEGLEPVPPNSNPLFTPLQEAGIVWTDLPARPNKLNQTGRVYVVKGDSSYLQVPHAVLPDMKDNTSFYPQMDEKFLNENGLQKYQTAIVGESALVASVGLILWGASKFMAPSATNQKMPRREFLKVAAGLMGAGAIGSLLRYELPDIAAVVPNEPTEEFLQTVDNVIRPRLTRSTFVDGRTALLLAKGEDAQAALPEFSKSTNVVVMGSGHMDMAPTYMSDNQERNKAIAAYTTELLDVAKQVYGTYYHISPEQLPPQAINSLLNYVTQVDVVEVSDPDGSSFQPNVAQAIDKQVTPYKSFHSPQVGEAIQHLRR